MGNKPKSSKKKIFPLFLHNIRSCDVEDIVKPYKGKSQEVLPTLRDEEFDFVYIDGSHFYTDVIMDLQLCSPLVSPSGVLGGDDLDLQKGEFDMQNAIINREKDCIIDTKTNNGFHPGVSLAIGEFFNDQKVSCYESFWIMRKTDGWEKIEIGSR